MEDLRQLKESYEKLKNKYNLPNFKELNQELLLEELQQTETEILAKKLRLLIWRKLGDILNMLERFVNPSHASILIMTIADKFSKEDRKILEPIYTGLGKFEIKMWKLESSVYSEKNEIQFVKEGLKKLKEIRPKLQIFIDRCKKIYDDSLKKK